MMDGFRDAFFFPMETKPFDEFEEYLGHKLNNRDTAVVGTSGDYPEKDSFKSMRAYVGEDEWVCVRAALKTDIGRRFYY